MQLSNAVAAEKSGNVLVVKFTREEIRSPLSTDVIAELERIVSSVEVDETVGKLVFTGTGDVFASGADLREIGKLTELNAPAFARRGQELMSSIERLKIETAAAINGYCFGGALDLALVCRRRIATPSAWFCHPGAGLGIITGWGGTQRLPRLVGEANALKMFLTAEPIGAEEALRTRLIDQIAVDPLVAAVG